MDMSKEKDSGFTYFLFEIQQKRRSRMNKEQLLYDGLLNWQRTKLSNQELFLEKSRIAWAQDDKAFKEFSANFDLGRSGKFVLERLFRDKRESDKLELRSRIESRSRGSQLELEEMCFAVLVTEHFVKTDKEEFFPAEVGLALFNLKMGAFQCYHTFLQPKDIPSGYRALMKELSDTRHEIPPFLDQARSDFQKVYEEMGMMVEVVKDSEASSMPTVFTLAEDYSQTQSALEFLASHSTDSGLFMKVACLEDLVEELERAMERTLHTPTHISSHFSKSAFDFARMIRCGFHEEKDVKYCARAQSLRECYHLLSLVGKEALIPKEGFNQNVEYFQHLLTEHVPQFQPVIGVIQRSRMDPSLEEPPSLPVTSPLSNHLVFRPVTSSTQPVSHVSGPEDWGREIGGGGKDAQQNADYSKLVHTEPVPQFKPVPVGGGIQMSRMDRSLFVASPRSTEPVSPLVNISPITSSTHPVSRPWVPEEINSGGEREEIRGGRFSSQPAPFSLSNLLTPSDFLDGRGSSVLKTANRDIQNQLEQRERRVDDGTGWGERGRGIPTMGTPPDPREIPRPVFPFSFGRGRGIDFCMPHVNTFTTHNPPSQCQPLKEAFMFWSDVESQRRSQGHGHSSDT